MAPSADTSGMQSGERHGRAEEGAGGRRGEAGRAMREDEGQSNHLWSPHFRLFASSWPPREISPKTAGRRRGNEAKASSELLRRVGKDNNASPFFSPALFF